MATISNHSLYVTCLSSSHKLLNKYVQLRTYFENSYREHLCNFNFEQYLSANCTISLSKKVEALKNACIDTRMHIGALLDGEIDSSLKDSYLAIYHQIWTPMLSATLAQIAKTSAAGSSSKVGNKTKPAAEVQVLPDLPLEAVDEVRDNLWKLAESNEVLYPKLCTKVGCAACAELLFDLPLSKCSVDCTHKKVTRLEVYPHLGRKFQDKLKPHHGSVSVKVKNLFKPNTYKNPMYEVESPSKLGPSIKELTKGVDQMELASSSATTSSQSVMSDLQPDSVLRETPLPDVSWASEVEEEEATRCGEPNTSVASPASPQKRKPGPVDFAVEPRKKAATPPRQSPRRSVRNART